VFYFIFLLFLGLVSDHQHLSGKKIEVGRALMGKRTSDNFRVIPVTLVGQSFIFFFFLMFNVSQTQIHIQLHTGTGDRSFVEKIRFQKKGFTTPPIGFSFVVVELISL
jgi:hypothetical protein